MSVQFVVFENKRKRRKTEWLVLWSIYGEHGERRFDKEGEARAFYIEQERREAVRMALEALGLSDDQVAVA